MLTNKKRTRALRLPFLAAVLLPLAASGTLAQQTDVPEPSHAMAPDSVRRAPVMISVEAQGRGAQEVLMTYSVPVTKQQVEADVAALRQAAGWVVDRLEITSSDEAYASSSGSNKLFIADFLTAGALDNRTGKLPIAPIVTAMRRYGKMIVLFDVDGPFVYRGSTSYHNGGLDVRMLRQQSGSGTYAFLVTVTGPASAPLDFQASAPAAPKPAGAPFMLRLGIALLLSLAVGWIAYQFILRLTLRVEGSPGS